MKYWVGGNGTWDASTTTNWANSTGGAGGASVPTATDDVFFDASSGTGTCTINASVVCNSIQSSGSALTTLSHNSGFTVTIGSATAGASNIALDFSGFTTYTLGNATTSAITFVSTSATVQTVNFNGKTTGNVTFNATSNGSWQYTGGHTCGPTAIVNFTQGSLDTNGQTCSWGDFRSTNNTTRNLTFGASTITITGTNAQHFAILSLSLTLSAASSTIILSGSGATFSGGGLTFGTVILSGGGTQSIVANGADFGTLTCSVTTQCILSITANITVTGTLTLTSNSAINRLLVNTDSIGTQRTITAATVAVTNADFMDITGAGTASWDISAGGNYAISGNSGIIFTAVSAPIVTDSAATGITNTLAQGNGVVTSDGGDATITERGFCWSTSANPTISDSKAVVAGTTGVFTGTLSVLLPDTTYHYRAYAINGTGTGYGANQEFTTSLIARINSIMIMGV